MTTAGYGSWRSPITAAAVVEGAVTLGQVEVDGPDIYWVEGRPQEGGRQVVVKAGGGDAVPADVNCRTRVHEYGGGAFTARGGTVFFSNFVDQRIYRVDPGSVPRPITPEPEETAGLRYADGRVSPDGSTLVCVREVHDGGDVRNEIVSLPADGSAAPRVLRSGHDFYASPRLSPDGSRLAYLCWDHPNMPWDGTDLWVDADKVAGGRTESVFQPEWAADGTLLYVSDRRGWWNLYRDEGSALCERDADFGVPQWVFGLSTYAPLPDGRIVCTWKEGGLDRIGVLHGPGDLRPLDVPYTSIGSLRAAGGDAVVFVGASARDAPEVVRLSLGAGRFEVLRRSREPTAAPGHLSQPEAIEFPTGGQRTAHALYYRPANPEYDGPPGERPPLLVLSHGGPTSATSSALNLGIQFWTSRGFAVVDVNYGGSTGYGREYRERLRGGWGVVDVEDCINAARHLAAGGEVDGRRLAIRGGSAGGYTTLCALTSHDVFAAGASYYGVADAELLAQETHKFESRYLDSLIGPYPEERQLYQERSPIHFVDRLSCPLIIFQGLEDEVVPPSQAEAMVAALRAKGLPFAYLAFAGEQHGFRQAATIVRTLEAELYFYGRVFGFIPADDIEPVAIENLDA